MTVAPSSADGSEGEEASEHHDALLLAWRLRAEHVSAFSENIDRLTMWSFRHAVPCLASERC
jgi:hypothetical protein